MQHHIIVIIFIAEAVQCIVLPHQDWGWGSPPSWLWYNTPPLPWQSYPQYPRQDLWNQHQQCECGQPGSPPHQIPAARSARQNDNENEVEAEDGVTPADRLPEEEEFTDRIVGGFTANAHQYPWLVLLLIQTDPIAASSLWCGGAIISARYVISAAHCIKGVKVENLKVVLGIHNRCISEHTSATISVISAEYPADFESKYLASDIALLRLSMKLTFSNVIRPICLPRPDAVYWGNAGEIAGWGKTTYGNSSGSCYLLHAKIPVLSSAACADSKYTKKQITRTHFCAGDVEHGGIDTCQGDSGGPLAIPRLVDGRYELVGVVSGGQGCALPGYPGLYTRVTDFLPWLAERTRDAPFCVRRTPHYNVWHGRSNNKQ